METNRFFEELTISNAATQTLVNLIDGGRLPHAILLEGPPRSGKTAAAMLLAAAALCEGEGERHPCGRCAHCRKVLAEVHPDIRVISGGGKSRSFHIDAVRELRAEAYIAPNEARSRVFVLRNVQEMTVEAQNALLKILEEPPAHLCFVLTVTNRSLLLETILSRVVTVQLAPASAQECAVLLRQNRTEEEKVLLTAAVLAQGSIEEAERLLEAGTAQTVTALFETLADGDEYALVRLLPREEKERAAQAALFVAARAIAVRLLTDRARGETPEPWRQMAQRFSQQRLSRLVEVFEEGQRLAESNCNVALLSGMIAARLKNQ